MRILLLALAVGLAACGSTPAAKKAKPHGLWAVPALGIVLSQSDSAMVSALDPRTGTTLFRVARRLPSDPPFGVYFHPPLACPPQATLDGKLMLRFSEGLYAIDPKVGHILWMQRLSPSKEPAVDPVLCAAVAPDSGVVVIVGRRKSVAKYDARGELAWKVDLPLDGAAVSIAQIEPTTGDVLVRISAHLVCFDATGRLKWTRPMDSNERAPSPEADGVDQE